MTEKNKNNLSTQLELLQQELKKYENQNKLIDTPVYIPALDIKNFRAQLNKFQKKIKSISLKDKEQTKDLLELNKIVQELKNKI